MGDREKRKEEYRIVLLSSLKMNDGKARKYNIMAGTQTQDKRKLTPN